MVVGFVRKMGKHYKSCLECFLQQTCKRTKIGPSARFIRTPTRCMLKLAGSRILSILPGLREVWDLGIVKYLTVISCQCKTARRPHHPE